LSSQKRSCFRAVRRVDRDVGDRERVLLANGGRKIGELLNHVAGGEDRRCDHVGRVDVDLAQGRPQRLVVLPRTKLGICTRCLELFIAANPGATARFLPAASFTAARTTKAYFRFSWRMKPGRGAIESVPSLM